MIKNVRTTKEVKKAVKIKANFDGNIQDYALAWLHLSNNAKVFPNVILKFYNNSYNDVYVIVYEENLESVKMYLESLSHDNFEVKIIEEEYVDLIEIGIDFEYVNYDHEAHFIANFVD